MSKSAIVCLAVVLLSSLSACFQTVSQEVILPSAQPSAAPTTNPEEADIFQVIHDNANSLNGDDIKGYTITLHDDSEFMRLMPAIYMDLRRFQTRYNIVSAKVQSLSAEIASVDVKRRTSDYTGTIDQDILYTLRKNSSGSWKIYTMVNQTQTR